MIKQIIDLMVTEKRFFFELFLTHLKISLITTFIAAILGLIIGVLISKNKKVANVVINIINVLYTIPSIALLGVLITITGIGNTTAIITLIIYGLLPMVRSTYTGIENVDKKIVEAAYAMGSTSSQIMFKIKLPLALPLIMSAIRNMVTMTIALGGISSFVGAGGLGVAIYRGITSNKPELIYSGAILVATLAIIMDFILGRIEKRLLTRRKFSKATKILVLIFVVFITSLIFISQFLMDKKEIKIATKPIPENYILGEITSQLIESNTDLNVKLTLGIGGGTSNIHPAMVRGDFDMYTEYTGTAWLKVLKEKDEYDETKFELLKEKYKQKFNFSWRGMYGFNNTFGVAVRKDVAEKYGLKNISDLARVSQHINFGANYDFFENPNGFKRLKNGYNTQFKKQVDMDNGLKYKALKAKQIDAVIAFTTEGQLADPEIVLLKDDKGVYLTYYAGNIVRNEILDKYPEIGKLLDKLDNILTEEKMSKLNYEVVGNGKKPEEVAKKFLQDNGLLGGN